MRCSVGSWRHTRHAFLREMIAPATIGLYRRDASVRPGRMGTVEQVALSSEGWQSIGSSANDEAQCGLHDVRRDVGYCSDRRIPSITKI